MALVTNYCAAHDFTPTFRGGCQYCQKNMFTIGLVIPFPLCHSFFLLSFLVPSGRAGSGVPLITPTRARNTHSACASVSPLRHPSSATPATSGRKRILSSQRTVFSQKSASSLRWSKQQTHEECMEMHYGKRARARACVPPLWHTRAVRTHMRACVHARARGKIAKS